MRLACLLLAFLSGPVAAAPVAWGRHWQVSVERIECSLAESSIKLGLRIRYLGPTGAAEAPENQLVDVHGRAHAPRSLVLKGGSKLLAAWLTSGGVASVKSQDTAELEFRYRMREDASGVKLEFGDIEAFALARPGKGMCEGMLKPAQVQAPPKPPRGGGKPVLRAFRGDTYPCAPERGEWRRVEAPHPPSLPEVLLVFGRGYLPSARRVELPMGRARAQTYAYAGPEDIPAIEEAARRVAAADFPAYGAKHYAYNWGLQRAASGNELYSVGIYAIRPCPK
jgi:hypothetical protein